MTADQSSAYEVWRPVVGWEGLYEVSNLGRVRALFPDDKLLRNYPYLTLSPNDQGYPRVSLHGRGKRERIKVHRLVALAFLGPCPVGYEVNHKDLNTGNPCLDNLEYITHQENIQHAMDRGVRRARGEKSATAKLTAADVLAIRASGESRSALARRYGVGYTTIASVLRGLSWTHV